MINFKGCFENLLGSMEMLEEDIKLFSEETNNKRKEEVLNSIKQVGADLTLLKTSIKNLYLGR